MSKKFPKILKEVKTPLTLSLSKFMGFRKAFYGHELRKNSKNILHLEIPYFEAHQADKAINVFNGHSAINNPSQIHKKRKPSTKYKKILDLIFVIQQKFLLLFRILYCNLIFTYSFVIEFIA